MKNFLNKLEFSSIYNLDYIYVIPFDYPRIWWDKNYVYHNDLKWKWIK